jgi:hypothetical protein
MSPAEFLVFLFLGFDLIGSLLLFQAEARVALRGGSPICLLIRKKCLGYGLICIASFLALTLAVVVSGMHKPVEDQVQPKRDGAPLFIHAGH